MFDVLKTIAKLFHEKQILFAIGGSIVLYHYGLVKKVNDIDIFIDFTNVSQVDSLLQARGVKKPAHPSAFYSTDTFMEYTIDDEDVDIMVGLGVRFIEGNYLFDFNKDSITGHMMLGDVVIPLTSLEDWYILYQLMPDRQEKVKIIEDYFMTIGCANPLILKNALLKSIPQAVKDKIASILMHQTN